LAAVITHMLQRDPAERATIDQARAGLHRVTAQESPPRTEPEQPEPITIQPSDAPSTDRKPGWNPNEETRRRPDAPPPFDPTPEVPRKHARSWRHLSRRAIVIATVVVAAAGATFGLLASFGDPGAPGSIQRLHPTAVNGSTKSGSAPTTVAASSPLSEDAAGQMVAFVNSREQIGDDYYVSDWRGPRVLPGTPRADSPIVVSPDGSLVFFIEPNKARTSQAAPPPAAPPLPTPPATAPPPVDPTSYLSLAAACLPTTGTPTAGAVPIPFPALQGNNRHVNRASTERDEDFLVGAPISRGSCQSAPGQQPVLGLAAELLMERSYSQPRQRQHTSASRRLRVRSALRYDTPNQIFENCGRSRI
jgi:hypothetical protein